MAERRRIRKDVLPTRVWSHDSNVGENNVAAYIGFLRKTRKSICSDVKIESIRLLGNHLEVTET